MSKGVLGNDPFLRGAASREEQPEGEPVPAPEAGSGPKSKARPTSQPAAKQARSGSDTTGKGKKAAAKQPAGGKGAAKHAGAAAKPSAPGKAKKPSPAAGKALTKKQQAAASPVTRRSAAASSKPAPASQKGAAAKRSAAKAPPPRSAVLGASADEALRERIAPSTPTMPKPGGRQPIAAGEAGEEESTPALRGAGFRRPTVREQEVPLRSTARDDDEQTPALNAPPLRRPAAKPAWSDEASERGARWRADAARGSADPSWDSEDEHPAPATPASWDDEDEHTPAPAAPASASEDSEPWDETAAGDEDDTAFWRDEEDDEDRPLNAQDDDDRTPAIPTRALKVEPERTAGPSEDADENPRPSSRAAAPASSPSDDEGAPSPTLAPPSASDDEDDVDDVLAAARASAALEEEEDRDQEEEEDVPARASAPARADLDEGEDETTDARAKAHRTATRDPNELGDDEPTPTDARAALLEEEEVFDAEFVAVDAPEPRSDDARLAPVAFEPGAGDAHKRGGVLALAKDIVLQALDTANLRGAAHAAGGVLQVMRTAMGAGSADSLDDYGKDRELTRALEPLTQFFFERYFRVAVEGAHEVPRGPCLLVANHSGALPYDGPLLAEALRRERLDLEDPRWLVEDQIFHAPFLGTLLNRLGAIRASPENALRLLDEDRPVIVFPEGIQGMGKPYRERYQLKRFGRGGFAKLALRSGAPIVPVAIVGAEETMPLLARLPGKFFGFPYLPLTPLGPLPLPARWTIRFGEPLAMAKTGAGADADLAEVHRLTERTRESIDGMLKALLRDRKSVYF